MQDIIVEKPYQFVPPHRGNWWPDVIQWLNLYGRHLRKNGGIVDFELRDQQRLRESIDARHGTMLAPNHCRTADPLVLGWLARDVGSHVFAMASWHLFNQDWFTSWAIHKMGAFSVNREGVDRKAINTAIQILETAERPLILFPEGAVSRTNDQLHALLDGVGFIARAAAKRRAKRDGGKVVIHPVAIKYHFLGDIDAAVNDVLSEIEHRFSWLVQSDLPLLKRVLKIGRALLCLKEIEYFGDAQEGELHDRLQGLVDRLLQPLEEEYFGERQVNEVVPRIKSLRIKILPDMVEARLDEAERERRWRQLADIYLAQQVSCYPADYLATPTVDRILETIERFEEDLTDRARTHGSMKAIIQVGEAIEVGVHRDRKSQGDPLMSQLAEDLRELLANLSAESRLYDGAREERGESRNERAEECESTKVRRG
jgi:1-acyl-sn-glycerol-3-phosphate acyltransferase